MKALPILDCTSPRDSWIGGDTRALDWHDEPVPTFVVYAQWQAPRPLDKDILFRIDAAWPSQDESFCSNIEPDGSLQLSFDVDANNAAELATTAAQKVGELAKALGLRGRLTSLRALGLARLGIDARCSGSRNRHECCRTWDPEPNTAKLHLPIRESLTETHQYDLELPR